MQQDENQKIAMTIVSPTGARMSRTRDSLGQQRVDARQRMSEGSAARENGVD